MWGVAYAIDQSEPHGACVHNLDYIIACKLSEHVPAQCDTDGDTVVSHYYSWDYSSSEKQAIGMQQTTH